MFKILKIAVKLGSTSQYFKDQSVQEKIGKIKIKISGCINACGHHHVGNIGILGLDRNGEESYQISLGGSANENTNIGQIVGPSFPEKELMNAIKTIIKTYENNIRIKGPDKIRPLKNIKTKEYPSFPTDLQAQFMVLLCKANGKSIITESIFENRFMHVAELQRLGAKINIKNNKAIIDGNTNFIGAELMSSDLRASVALVLAAIVANGKSVINRIYHLDRGYENIENKLKKIGVKIKRLK